MKLIFTTTIVGLIYSFSISAFAQEIKTYKGAYVLAKQFNGIASYSYKELDDVRIKEGLFTFSYVYKWEVIKINGKYLDGKRNGRWETITNTGGPRILVVDPQNNTNALMGDGIYKISGEYINDLREGPWNLIGGSLINNTVKSSIKSKANFKDGRLNGAFTYEYNDPTNHARFSSIKVDGNFSNDGFATGIWNIKFLSWNNIENKDIIEFDNGFLISYQRIDLSTGEKKEFIDDSFGRWLSKKEDIVNKDSFIIKNLYFPDVPIGSSLVSWLGDPTFMEYQTLYLDKYFCSGRMKVVK